MPALIGWRLVGASALCVAIGGCAGSGDDYEVAPVQGVVLCDGQPVSGGTVLFTPVSSGTDNLPGKGAAGTIADDGTFVMSTYGSEDGAIVGRHTVMASHSNPAHPWNCTLQQSVEYEVVPGENDVVIELTGQGAGLIKPNQD